MSHPQNQYSGYLLPGNDFATQNHSSRCMTMPPRPGRDWAQVGRSRSWSPKWLQSDGGWGWSHLEHALTRMSEGCCWLSAGTFAGAVGLSVWPGLPPNMAATSMSEHPEREVSRRFIGVLSPNLGSHVAPLLLHSLHQRRHKGLPRFKRRRQTWVPGLNGRVARFSENMWSTSVTTLPPGSPQRSLPILRDTPGPASCTPSTQIAIFILCLIP